VWDVLSLSFDEAPWEQFKEGQRFQVRFKLALWFWFLCSEALAGACLLPLNYIFTFDAEECVDGAHVKLSTTKTS
jgi:hypothetical protein